MFQSAAFELARLEHNHGNNEWHEMQDVTPDQDAEHDAAAHDPERLWTRGRIYRCTTCDDEIRVVLPDPVPVERSITEP